MGRITITIRLYVLVHIRLRIYVRFRSIWWAIGVLIEIHSKSILWNNSCRVRPHDVHYYRIVGNKSLQELPTSECLYVRIKLTKITICVTHLWISAIISCLDQLCNRNEIGLETSILCVPPVQSPLIG
jgi:hypothetical protein